MRRLSVVALPSMLCVLAFASASCRVYDAELLAQLGTGGRADGVRAAGVARSPADSDASVTSFHAASERVIVPGCGNGHVDERERCDTAIAQGEPGACPDGCDTRDGCLAAELMGQRCGARCEPIEITDSVSGDGCCPNGATPDSDSDCSGTCGNGVIEAAETCDPPERCATAESCTTNKLCTVAHLTGAAGTCSARCQELPITECESGDNCCPDGCDAEVDRDCVRPPREPTSPSEGGAAPQAPNTVCMDGQQCSEEQQANECSMVHSGGRCHSCDCAYCAAEVASCEMATKDTQGCSRLVECALQNHCQGLACLCGANLNTCANLPIGPCLLEIREVAGSRDYYSILWTASTPGTPLAIAMNLVQCRADHCAETCGL